VTGAGTPAVEDDRDNSRLLVVEGRDAAQLDYQVEDDRLYLLHTEVPEAFRGQGIGAQLVAGAVEKAAKENLTIVPWCPYARRWLKDHPHASAEATVDFTIPPPV
jgi:predicted GNAT family acetyltransferase